MSEFAYDNIDFCRGDIYYVRQGFPVGTEMKKGRPAVIVSNDTINRGTGVISVVYLTSQEKKEHPTRVKVKTKDGTSTAMCEQISSIDRSRFGDRLGQVTSDEMRLIEKGIAFALALGHDEIFAARKMVGGGMTKAETELAVYKELYSKLLESLEKGGYVHES